jgi:type IV secretion system protein VirB9
MQYSYTGAKALLPDHMFDDGRNTFLYYPAHRRKPKLFAVGTDGSERPLPVRSGNQYLTISGVYSRMTLRMGDEHTCIYNEMKHPPPP